jgi:hypothetical protein
LQGLRHFAAGQENRDKRNEIAIEQNLIYGAIIGMFYPKA